MQPTRPIRVVQYGLGPIGLECVRVLLARQATGKVELVGAIDIDPAKSGRDVGALIGLSATGIDVEADARAVLERTEPDVVVHTTSSFLDRVVDQLVLCAEAGANVVSSSEELFYPFVRQPETAGRLDMLARKNGISIVGTGVNPGFVMDTLVLTATSMCVDVRAVRARRVVEAAHRRFPLQRKIGAGMSLEAWNEMKETGTFGHIGLVESLYFVAAGLGWTIGEVREELRPMIAETAVTTPYLKVQPGQAAGIYHTARGFDEHGREIVSLDLRMFVGAGESIDTIQVDGVPPVEITVPGGIFGDTATVSALVNTIPMIVKAEPGLRTTMDLPVPRAFATR